MGTGKHDTITGTDQYDTITGTGKHDTITGTDQHDTITGTDQHDTVCDKYNFQARIRMRIYLGLKFFGDDKYKYIWFDFCWRI